MNTDEFICPRCRGALKKISESELHCSTDRLTFKHQDGIWRFLLPEREAQYVLFTSDYEAVRRFEGRGSSDPAYYRALPFHDLSMKFSGDWRIRAKSYKALEQVIAQHLFRHDHSIHIVDCGAGNGWLSNRLALRGFQVSAVDLLVNAEDGLGAWKHYQTVFTPVQAEFTQLPFIEESISVVVFNASFHYSEHYEETLSETMRILLPDGMVVVMDSPVYRDAHSGEQMVAERRMNFTSKYGFASDSIRSENYLTYDRMGELANKFGLHWRHVRPFYGIRWMIRPWLARLRGGREPAQFGLWVGVRSG
jgi:SAM-dependent methyltransferase